MMLKAQGWKGGVRRASALAGEGVSHARRLSPCRSAVLARGCDLREIQSGHWLRGAASLVI